MNQIYWMLGLIPDAVLSGFYWGMIIAGITGVLAGWLGKWIPFYGNYVKILQPVGIVLLVLGVWLRGGYDTEMAWRDKVAKLEEQVKVAEQKSQETNTVIQEKVVEKTKIVRERGQDIIKYVDKWNTKEIVKEVQGPERIRREEVIKYIENCPVPKEMIDLHNQAVDVNRAAEGKK
jgi:flagellar biosynthesis component FlhA